MAEKIRAEILENINDIRGLLPILKDLRTTEDVSMEEKVDLMRLVFVAESKTSKYDLITFLWNFLKILYNDMNKLIVRLIPAIKIERATELTKRHVILFKEITTRLYYVMVYMKDDSAENVEVMCRNVLVLSKCLLKDKNYTEFFNLAKETFFNPKHMYQLKIFTSPSTAHDLFLEHFLTRLWELRDLTCEDLPKGLSANDILEKFFQIFLFYVNYEAKHPDSEYNLTDKLISVLLNLNWLTKANKETCDSVKCLYSLIQVMKADSGQETAIKGLLQYVTRITEKTVLNCTPVIANALATIGLVLEKNAFFGDEANLKAIPVEGVRNLLHMVKLTVGLNVEPGKLVCELKDCVKGSKKHTITNWTRFAQKIFVAYVGQLGEDEAIDEDLLTTATQLIIFHFHVLDRLSCPSRAANEHNDVRRLYSTFAPRSKSNPHASVLKIFEILLKYLLQRNLAPLVSPLLTLLLKYYTEMNDQSNCTRLDWINMLCLHDNAGQSDNFNNYCYNWAVKKQNLTKEAVQTMLQIMLATKLDYQTEIIPKCVDEKRIILSILESIAAPSIRAFRTVQECLVERIVDKCEDSWEDLVSVLFYATDSQVITYKEDIDRAKAYFDKQKDSIANCTSKAVLYSLTYQVYIAELRRHLKTVDISALHNRELDLSVLSVERDNQELMGLRRSLGYLEKIKSANHLSSRQIRQVVGTLKRNARFFQLAGLEFEEVSACRLLYEIGKELKDVESSLLAMANLMNHVHFIIKDEKCRTAFPNLIRVITGEGSNLLLTQLKKLPGAKESLQTLIVFGVGNMIKLNADLGRKEKCFEYLQYLKQKIEETTNKIKDDGMGVTDLQYNLISYQLFLKYAQKSNVNHLMVAREIFSAVRLLHKASDLYALYLYDVLVELLCFSVPRYETKGLDYYILLVLKYFMGTGSVTRIMDVLLVYSNWSMCCENIEKGLPSMEYMADIMTQPGNGKLTIVGGVKEKTDEELSLKRILEAVKSLNVKDSVRLAICGFKVKCLLARKYYIDRSYEQSLELYEEAWQNYDSLYEKIANHGLRMDFQQFYVNVLFQLSNVYYKMGLCQKSLRFCESTTLMISEIRVNRIALMQETHFQGLHFKSEIGAIETKTIVESKSSRAATVRRVSPVSPMQIEMAMLLKGTPSRTAKKVVRQSAKRVKIKVEPPELVTNTQLAVVDENSSTISNIAPNSVEVDQTKRKTVTRKIPVRATSIAKKTPIQTCIVPKGRPITVSSAGEAATPATGTRKTSRRLM